MTNLRAIPFSPPIIIQNTQIQITQVQSQAAAGLLSGFSGPFNSALPPPLLPPPGYSTVAMNQSLAVLGQGGLGHPGLGIGGSLASCLCHLQRRHMPMTMGCFMNGVKKAEGTDKFATHKSCRTGKHNPSNLNNSDHITLALYDLLSKSKQKRGGFNSFKDPKALQKKLEEDYGIKCELTTVKSKEGDKLKALKFENGAVFADGAGDGQLDMGDYNFKGAIADIEKRYGAKADDLIKTMKDTRKAYDANPHLKQFGGIEDMYANALHTEGQANQMLAGFKAQFGAGAPDPALSALGSELQGLSSCFFPTREIFALFVQAYLLAGCRR